jgi:hypothetical protein
MYVNKKPLGMIEAPVKPFIQKNPDRYYTVRKKNMVNVGDVLMEHKDDNYALGDTVLAVRRDENITRYGTKSYTPKVNKEFRPPLVDPEYDLTPLSRIPRPRTQMSVNPGSEQVDKADVVLHDVNVQSKISDRNTFIPSRPTFKINYVKPMENRIIPDLKLNLPQVSANSGYYAPSMYEENNRRDDINLNKRTVDVYEHAGAQVDYRTSMSGQTSLEDLELDRRNEQVNATSGVNSQYRSALTQQTSLEDLELDSINPHVNVSSGFSSEYREMNQTSLEDLELDSKNPSVEANAGIQAPIQSRIQVRENFDLVNNRPQTNVYVNPSIPMNQKGLKDAGVAAKEVKFLNPLQVSHSVVPNYNVQVMKHNTNPGLKQTLDVSGSANAMPLYPQRLQHQTPTLRSKK